MERDIFAPKIPEEKMHSSFQQIRSDKEHTAARRLMNEVFGYFHDTDKNFIREFQSNGFSPRVFELALFAYLHEQGITPDRDHPAPDFVTHEENPVAIEVTTTNPPQGIKEENDPACIPILPEDMPEANRAFVFQLGKALRRKLEHRDASDRAYWEKPHVQGTPFVIAVGAFHDQHAQLHKMHLVAEYLYGHRDILGHDESGNITVTRETIKTHLWRDKEIPSGLFKRPEAANLSGVLFSNAHTVAMFNRIGTEFGYGPHDVALCRLGSAYDPAPNASEAQKFGYVVGDRAPEERENFSEGLVLFINPWAATKLSPQALPGIPYFEMGDEGQVISMLPAGFLPFDSKTIAFEGEHAHDLARYFQLAYLGLIPDSEH
ncbi:hypothetical protein [Streptomyces albiaxialis]